MNGRKRIIGDAIKFGFRALVKHVCLFVMTLLAGVAASIVLAVPVGLAYLQFGQQLFGLYPGFIYLSMLPFGLILLVFYSGLYLGLNTIALELCDRGKSSVKKLFSCFKLVPRYCAALILYLIAVAAGTVLFILPGIFIGIRFSLFSYYIIDQNAGVIESLKMSYNITRNYGWSLFLLGIVVYIIMSIPKLLGLLFAPIGLIGYLFTIPFSVLVYAFFYRSLVAKAE